MTPPTVIKDLWDDYAKNVLDEDRSSESIERSKLDFYCGAAALFSVLMHILNPEIPKKEAWALIECIRLELSDYCDTK